MADTKAQTTHNFLPHSLIPEAGQVAGTLGFGASGGSNVYLLAHRTANLVKIGKANSIIFRAETLGLDDFDLSKSIGLQVKTEREAFDLERLLHTVFKAHRLPVEQVSSTLNHDSGMTEWFSSDCMERAQEFLAHINDMVPFKRVAVSIPANPENPKRAILTQQDREIRQQKEADKARLVNESSRKECIESFSRLSELVTFQGVTIQSDDSFEVHFTSGSGRSAGMELQTLNRHGCYHRPSGFTSIIGDYSAKYPMDGSLGTGRFKVLRPYSKTMAGKDGEAIESMFCDVLDALRSIPNTHTGQLFCITH